MVDSVLDVVNVALANNFSSSTSDSTNSQVEFRANPCWFVHSPSFPNCGKHIGIPPRIGFDPSKIAFFDTNKNSGFVLNTSKSESDRQLATCAPKV